MVELPAENWKQRKEIVPFALLRRLVRQLYFIRLGLL